MLNNLIIESIYLENTLSKLQPNKQKDIRMLKKMSRFCAVSVLSCSMASGYEIVIDSTIIGDFMRNDSSQVVYDLRKNLMWQDDASAKTVTKNWQEAIDYCRNLKVSGYSDWRLPNLEELRTLVDKNNLPTIKSGFKNTVSGYDWSNTRLADGSNRAWVVGFENGYGDDDYKSHNNYVRCVRDSK